ncbi:MAG: acyl-CoA reductase [Bacteroidota bacterium]
MISLNTRIQAFDTLGKLLQQIGENNVQEDNSNGKLMLLEQAVVDAPHYNGWFIEENARYMLAALGKSLTKVKLEKWIEPYKHGLEKGKKASTVGVVMAGNVPVVGFHDFLSVLISGNKILAKLSSDDEKLLPLIADLLIDIEPEFKEMVEYTSNRLTDFDAIIATGSNNTSRYFEYYFGKYPNIIRKNRNSIALITGDETDDDLQNLSKDIFRYFGLGCRNVSHILIPKGHDLNNMLRIFSLNEEVTINHKYFNNYEYNKAIYLVNSKKHFDTGNLLLTEDSSFSSPVSVIHYEYYNDINSANRLLEVNSSKIQCVVTKSNLVKDAVPLGFSQSPELWDYADGIDTMKFLIDL